MKHVWILKSAGGSTLKVLGTRKLAKQFCEQYLSEHPLEWVGRGNQTAWRTDEDDPWLPDFHVEKYEVD